MNFEDFESQLDTFGSQWSNWPDWIREEAQGLVRTHPEAQELYRQALQLHSLLTAEEMLKAPSHLRAKILQKIALGSQKIGWLDNFLANPWRSVAVAFIPLCLGIAIGFFDQESVDTLEEEIVALTFTDLEAMAGVMNGT